MTSCSSPWVELRGGNREFVELRLNENSNLRKVHATSPSGSIADIPPGLGAGIAWANGFECVGIFKGDDAWVQEKCKEKLLERLGPLDKIEQLEDYERCHEVARLTGIDVSS